MRVVSSSTAVSARVFRRLAWIALLCVPLASTSCSGAEPDGAGDATPAVSMTLPVLRAAPADMHALVPADTLAYVQVASLDALGDASDVYAKLVDPRSTGGDPRDWLELLGLSDPSRVDTSRPCALAVGPAEAGFPVTLVVVTIEADGAARAAPPGTGVATRGAYTAFSLGRTDPGPAGSPLTLDLPAGTVAGRVDLPPLVDAARPGFELAMGVARMQAASQTMPPTVDMEALLDATAEMMRGLMDAVESLEFAVGQDGRDVVFRGALTVDEHSALAGFSAPEGGDLADLASRIDPTSVFQMFVRADMDEVMDRSEGLLRKFMLGYMVPAGGEVDVDEMMGAWSALYRLGRGNFAGTFEIGRSPLGLAVFDAENAEAVVRTYARLVEEGLMDMSYSQVELASESVVEGVPVATFLTRIDLDRLMEGAADDAMREQMLRGAELAGGAEEGMLSYVFRSGDRVGMVFGAAPDSQPDPEVVAAIARPAGAPSPELAGLIELLESHQAGVALRLDMLDYMRTVVALASRDAVVPTREASDRAAAIGMAAAVDGDTWDLVFAMDLGGLIVGLPSTGIDTVGR